MPRHSSALNKEVGEKLLAARTKKGLTQAELAALAKINQTVVSRVEQGVIPITMPMFERLANAMGGLVLIELILP